MLTFLFDQVSRDDSGFRYEAGRFTVVKSKFPVIMLLIMLIIDDSAGVSCSMCLLFASRVVMNSERVIEEIGGKNAEMKR